MQDKLLCRGCKKILTKDMSIKYVGLINELFCCEDCKDEYLIVVDLSDKEKSMRGIK